MRRIRIFLLPFVVLCAAGLGIWFVLQAGARDREQVRPANFNPVLQVDSVILEPQRFEETLTATGTLLPNESVELQSELSGTISEILFQEGEEVRAGTVLVRIDDSEWLAQYARARAALELEELNEKRQRGLLASRNISEADYDASVAGLHKARADVQLIEAQLAKTRIRAPFDGIAGLRQVSLGAYVTPGTRIASFQEIQPLKLEFTVPERYTGRVRPGQTFHFSSAAHGRSFEGEIYAVEPAIEQATRSVVVRGLADNEERLLLPGGFVEVRLEMGVDEEALIIPALALIPGLGKASVYVNDDGRAALREIEVSQRTRDAVRVVSGLEAGDEVIYTGILQLRPGDAVTTRVNEGPFMARGEPAP